MMRDVSRVPVLAVAVCCALLVVGSAAASVRITKKPGRVTAGDTASVTVAVSPSARCTIGVYYSTTKSGASGLGPKKGATVKWTWRVGTNTKHGSWPVKIDCGKSGKAQTVVTVR